MAFRRGCSTTFDEMSPTHATEQRVQHNLRDKLSPTHAPHMHMERVQPPPKTIRLRCSAASSSYPACKKAEPEGSEDFMYNRATSSRPLLAVPSALHGWEDRIALYRLCLTTFLHGLGLGLGLGLCCQMQCQFGGGGGGRPWQAGECSANLCFSSSVGLGTCRGSL